MIDIKTPLFPESIEEGTIATWHKTVGDIVYEGDIIAEIETDKTMMEVPAQANGTISEIIKFEGDDVVSEEVIAKITAGNTTISENQNPEIKNTPIENSFIEKVEIFSPTYPESIEEGTISSWNKKIGDFVEEGDVITEIETDKTMMEVQALATGILSEIYFNEGDDVKSNVLIASISAGETTANVQQTEAPKNNTETSNNSLIPSARRAVGISGVDANQINGTGKGGRITKNDINNAKTGDTAVGVNLSNREDKRVKMTRLRQTIAKRLVDVQQTNAILTTFNEVDMKPVMDLRKKFKDVFLKEHDTKLGFMSFFLKATTEALKKFPEVNASIDGTDVVYHNYFDIGVAVGTDRGLVVPVIRDTDKKSFAGIETDILAKALLARDGKLTLDDMQGGTFTITNGGTYGSMLSTPIINSPQSAILGMHNIIERPIAENGQVVIRPMMYLALSYDHRIIDGGTSVRFLKMIKELLEDPARMLLAI